MAIGDVFRVTMNFAMPESVVAQWVWHYIQTTGSTFIAQNIADAIITIVETAYGNIDQNIDPQVSGDSLEIALWDAVLKQFDTINQTDITTIVGTATGDMLPHQNAGVVKFFTDVGRSIGKKFIMGITESQDTEGRFSATQVTNMALFAADFDDSVIDGVRTFVPGNFNVATEVFRNWNGTVEALALVASQDRRKPGIGI